MVSIATLWSSQWPAENCLEWNTSSYTGKPSPRKVQRSCLWALRSSKKITMPVSVCCIGLQSQVNGWPCKWDLWPAVTKHTKTLSPSASFQQVTGPAKRCLQWPKDREIEPVCDLPSQCILSVSDVQNYAFVSALMAVNPFYIKHVFMVGGILSG